MTVPESPQPSSVFEGREKIQAEGRMPEYRDGARKFFCRSCEKTEYSNSVPRGWYLISRAVGEYQPHQRLGIYCCWNCVEAQSARIKGVERDLGATWTEAPSAVPPPPSRTP